MAAFIPAISLFILVLFNGYFTLPIVDEQLSNSTFPLLNDDVTTENAVNSRLVLDDETTVLPYMDKKGLTDEHLGFEVSTSFLNVPEEKVGQAIRTFDELSTREPMTFTTESSLPDKRGHYDFSFTTVEPTTESSVDYEQGHHDFSSTTVEPTTESSVDYEQGHHDVSSTTVEPTTPLPQLEIRSLTSESESESEADKREIEVEFTTSDTLSFTSRASNIAPELYRSKLSTSTKKYPGLLKYKNEIEDEQEPEESTKLMKTFKKVLTTKPSKIQTEDLSVEDPKEPTAPTAVFDQEALKKVSYFPNDFMVLDENNTVVVTDLPEKYPVSTMKYKNEEQPLTQGSTLLLFLLAALLLCACVMASTLAFVKNRYNLKRKSRITEMEAHLDEHYQHYSHPFMFQQHYEKQ